METRVGEQTVVDVQLGGSMMPGGLGVEGSVATRNGGSFQACNPGIS
jgi:hypothetical protein